MLSMAEAGYALVAVGVPALIGFGYWLKQMHDLTQELILRKFRRTGLRRAA